MALSQVLQFEHAAAIGSASGRLLQAVLMNDLPERDRALVTIADTVLAFQVVLDSKPAASKPGADSKGTAGSARAAPKRGPAKRASSASSRIPKVRTCEVRWRMNVCGLLESFESIVLNVICAGSCDASLARLSVCFPQLPQKKNKADGGSASGVTKPAPPTKTARSNRHDQKVIWFKWPCGSFANMKGKIDLVRASA